jgi:hypothetical protein
VTTAKTYADCHKAGGVWNAKTNTVLRKKDLAGALKCPQRAERLECGTTKVLG